MREERRKKSTGNPGYSPDSPKELSRVGGCLAGLERNMVRDLKTSEGVASVPCLVAADHKPGLGKVRMVCYPGTSTGGSDSGRKSLVLDMTQAGVPSS